jgi:class 3 adenylate cyclase/DNA-binding XRE family transcriptional regulator
MGATDGSGSLGGLLLHYRLAAGLSQEELAERAGLSRRSISELERGARRAPYPATVRRLTEVLGLDAAERAAWLASLHAAAAGHARRAPEDRPPGAPATHPLGAQLPDPERACLAELVPPPTAGAAHAGGARRQGGLSVRATSDLERGLRRFPYGDTLQRLVNALGLIASDRALLEAAAVRLGLRQPTLPVGTVTFLFTDVEGSTAGWLRDRHAMGAALARHDVLIEQLVAEHGGHVVRPRGEGDSRFAVFARASDAVVAACAVQIALVHEPWDLSGPLRVRIAVHTGEADLRLGDYYGPAVNHCARLGAVAHGGQILISAVTADLVREALAPELTLRDLGEHQLQDLKQPERIWQVVHPHVPADFPPLTSQQAGLHNLRCQLTSFIGRTREAANIRQELAKRACGR